MHKLSLTRLRANLYQVVDKVIETGEPVEIERHRKKVRIVLVETKPKLERLKKHSGTIIGNPDDIVHMDWSSEWNANQDI